MKNHDVARLIFNTLKLKNVKISLQSLRDSLFSHPYHLSIQSASDSLSDMRIANAGLRISFEQLEELLKEADVLLFLKEKGDEYFVTVSSIANGVVELTNSDKKTHSYTKEELEKIWDGVAIAMQVDETAKDSNYEKHASKQKLSRIYLSFVLLAVALLAGLFIGQSSQPLSSAAILLPKLLGIFFSFLLASTELGFNVPIADKLCSMSTNDGCTKVLHSKASSVGRYFQLADVGIAYFTGAFICLLMLPNLQPLAIVSVLALPFVIFSICYQNFVVKAFCPLCLSVMSMLILDAVSYYLLGYVGYTNITWQSCLLLMAALLLTAGGWMLVKQVIQKAKRLQTEEYRYLQLRKNPERIAAMLQGVEEENLGAAEEGILLGDARAKLTITEVLNPYCNPCSKAVDSAVKLLDLFSEGVQVSIRFISARSEEQGKITKHLLAYAKENDTAATQQALVDWYKDMSYDSWSAKYPVSSLHIANEQLAKLEEWSKQHQIAYTPTSFLNGKRMPTSISFDDLRYWIADVVEEE